MNLRIVMRVKIDYPRSDNQPRAPISRTPFWGAIVPISATRPFRIPISPVLRGFSVPSAMVPSDDETEHSFLAPFILSGRAGCPLRSGSLPVSRPVAWPRSHSLNMRSFSIEAPTTRGAARNFKPRGKRSVALLFSGIWRSAICEAWQPKSFNDLDQLRIHN